MRISHIFPEDFRFGAVYINQDDHAYANVRFDRQSTQWFTKNISKVDDNVTRAAIWRYFWKLVVDCQMSSLVYFDFLHQ